MSLKMGSFTLPPIGHPRCAGPRMQPELCAQEPTIFLSLSEFPLYARHEAKVGLREPGMKSSHRIGFPSKLDPCLWGEVTCVYSF